MRVETDGGEVIDLGTTEATPTIGIIDYSRRVTDDFGVTTVVERGFARRMSVRLALPFDNVDALQRRLAGLRSTSALWVADDAIDWLRVRGFYKDFELDLAVPPVSFCTLTIEGLAESEAVADPGGDPAPAGTQSTLRLLQPSPVVGGALVTSNVPETDHPEWAATATYDKGARVILAATHRVYESVTAGNLGSDPAGASGKWLDVGPTNRWAMFDQALGTITSRPGVIEVTLSAGTVNAVALLDVLAATVRVQAQGYDRTIATGTGAITFLDLPSASGPVTVTVTGPGMVSVGTLLIGKVVDLGITEASPTAGITDFSRKEVDDFGEVTVVQRAFAKRMTARALIRTDAVDIVANRIAAVRARPSLWIGQTGLDSLTIYGFFKDFSIEVGANVSKLSLSVEGLSVAAPVLPLAGGSGAWPDITDPDGTKPEDNATNGTPPGAPLGTRPVEDFLSDFGDLTTVHLGEIFRFDEYKALNDARQFVEGQPLKTFALDLKTDTARDMEAINARLKLLGVQTQDGTGFILDADVVQLRPGEKLVETIDQLGLKTADHDLDISTINEILINDDGATAKALLRVTADGSIAGFEATASGEVGSTFKIYANVFKIIDPAGGAAISPFTIENGVVKMRNVEVDTITVGAVTRDVFAIGEITTKKTWAQSWPAGIAGNEITGNNGNTWYPFGNIGARAVLEFPETPFGANWAIRFYCNAKRTGDDNDRIAFRLKRTGAGESIFVGEEIPVGLSSTPSVIVWEWNSVATALTGNYSFSIECNRKVGTGTFYNAKFIADVGYR